MTESNKTGTEYVPLIAAKHVTEYGEQEYHDYVSGMYELRQKGSKPAKAKGPAQGITISRTKKGALSIRRNAKSRPFAYILRAEMEALCAEQGILFSELWNAFKAKDFLIAKDKMEAEQIYANIKQVPL